MENSTLTSHGDPHIARGIRVRITVDLNFGRRHLSLSKELSFKWPNILVDRNERGMTL